MHKKLYITLFIFFASVFCLFSEIESELSKKEMSLFFDKLANDLPASILNKILKNKKEFFYELDQVLKSEQDDSLILVDKEHLLNKDFAPSKVVMLRDLKAVSYLLDRNNIELSLFAVDPLNEMAKAARRDGVTLVVSSAYRPYKYQEKLFNRYVKWYGLKKASRFSAKPGSSQHQLGTTIDFGTIDASYADTAAGKWLFKNASKYGWSLSYPKGFEAVTGYEWECWHYRYIGHTACAFQKKWFNDIQQYMLEFIDAWKKNK